MYHIFAAQGQTQFRAAEQIDPPDATAERPQPLPGRGRRIGGGDQHRDPVGAQRRRDLLEPGHHRAASPRQTEVAQTAFGESCAYALGEISARGDRRPRRPREAPVASSTTAAEALSHSPRPGSLPARSGVMRPSGETTNRTSVAGSLTSPVRMQRRLGLGASRRVGPLTTPSSPLIKWLFPALTPR